MNIPETDLAAKIEIVSPAQLESLLRNLTSLLRCGALKHIVSPQSLVGPIDFDQLEASGPWPDIIEGEFVDGQGRRYHLFVDTYHGTVGTWIRSDVD